MSDAPVWTCEFFPLKDEGGVALDSLTVGAKFGMKCHGDIAIQWDPNAKPSVTFAKEEDAYTLAVLKVVQQDPNDTQYVVTAYKPGEHAPEYVRFLQGKGTPGEKGFEVMAPKWQVKSVIDPKQQPPPQPFPAVGPFHLSLPLWILAVVFFLLLGLFYLVLRRVRKHSQRRRMLEDMKLHKTALSPLHQFYKDARQLRRRMHNVKEEVELQSISTDLERDFKLFVLRKFQIPTLEWSDRAILEDLRKRHKKTYKIASQPLKKTLRELAQMKLRKKLDLRDVEQLHRMSLDAAERLEGGGHL